MTERTDRLWSQGTSNSVGKAVVPRQGGPWGPFPPGGGCTPPPPPKASPPVGEYLTDGSGSCSRSPCLPCPKPIAPSLPGLMRGRRQDLRRPEARGSAALPGRVGTGGQGPRTVQIGSQPWAPGPLGPTHSLCLGSRPGKERHKDTYLPDFPPRETVRRRRAKH